jgi:thiopeptide-type bacteriocin biosynthesis protein
MRLPDVLEAAVLEHLSGSRLEAAADGHGLTASELSCAVQRYTAAGRTALVSPPSRWRQLDVEFTDPRDAEQTAREHLLPVLTATRAEAAVQPWWFMRKPPGWRVRIAPPAAGDGDLLDEVIAGLERAARWGAVAAWRQVIYEEETTAFGGVFGMDLAHRLFHADSAGLARALLTRRPGWSVPDRIVASLLLMSHLHRAAGLDVHERADVWAKVAACRDEQPLDNAQARRLESQARVLLTRDTSSLDPPAVGLDVTWMKDFADSGAALAQAARAGRLERGLRAVLALHVIFHWNRMGIPADLQAIWSHSAHTALLADLP